MFGTTETTQFDVHLRLFGIPIRIHPMYWLISGLLGQPYNDAFDFAIWMVVCFVSLLMHEMGHALAFTLFGRRSHIVLHAMGGYAMPEYNLNSPGRRLVVALAGPAVTFSLALIAFLVLMFTKGIALDPMILRALVLTFAINLFWGIFNMLPIWPMDGGRALGELFIIMKLRYPEIKIHKLSIALAAFLAVYGLLTNLGMRFPAIDDVIPIRPSIMMTIFFGLFIYYNWVMLQQYHVRRVYYDDADVPPWRR